MKDSENLLLEIPSLLSFAVQLKSLPVSFKQPDPKDPTAWREPADSPRSESRLPIAIIGAGVSGLRIAMLLDHLDIPYEIFEASQRHGGRCYTYHFTREEESGLKHDYFDVGAMRFPQNPAMKSLFTLFQELDITADGGTGGRLLPFIDNTPGNFLMYNGIKKTSEEVNSQGDHFHDGECNHGSISNEYITRSFTKSNGHVVYGVDACYAAALEPFAQALIKDARTGWDQLMKYDTLSAKAFFLQVMQYPWDVIQWMEDRVYGGTGLFDMGFTEAVLEYLSFSCRPPSECSGDEKETKWWCIDGGTEVLTNTIHKALKTKPCYSHRVTSVSMSNPEDAATSMKITVAGHPEFSDREYSHVISTVPFPCLRTIDISGCGLTYKQNRAIRFLERSSLKIGIKFKTRWWQYDSHFTKQVGGASFTDRPIRGVVYPSYGLDDDPRLPGVLIASYSCNDATIQLGSYVQDKVWGERQQTRPDSEILLLEQVYQDLAALHGQTPDWYKTETVDYYAYAWHKNPNTMGAFAYFGPGDFSSLYPSVTVPAAHGKFHFAGAAASLKHSWIAGALDAAWRCVHEILVNEDSPQLPDFLKKYAAESHGCETSLWQW